MIQGKGSGPLALSSVLKILRLLLGVEAGQWFMFGRSFKGKCIMKIEKKMQAHSKLYQTIHISVFQKSEVKFTCFEMQRCGSYFNTHTSQGLKHFHYLRRLLTTFQSLPPLQAITVDQFCLPILELCIKVGTEYVLFWGLAPFTHHNVLTFIHVVPCSHNSLFLFLRNTLLYQCSKNYSLLQLMAVWVVCNSGLL